ITVLAANGVPTPPVATRLVPPVARMAPLTDAEMAQRLASSDQVKEYAQAIDRESARELLAERMSGEPEGAAPTAAPAAPASKRTAAAPKSALEQIFNSSLTRTVTREVT